MGNLFFIPLMVLAVAALILCSCSSPSSAPTAGWPKSLILGSGPVGGGFDVLASGIAPIWKEELNSSEN